MSDVKSLLEERTQLMDKTLSNERGSRIPVLTQATSWKYFYAGYKPQDGLDNPEVVNMEINRKFYSDFYMDSALCTRTGCLFTPRAMQLLDGGTYTYNRFGLLETRPGSVTVMNEDEYPELIANPYKFILEKVLPRRYGLMVRNDENKYTDMKQVMQEIFGLIAKNGKEDKIASEEFGIPLMRLAATMNPVDYILDYLRDFKDIIKDIRRRPEEVRDAGMALLDYVRANVAALEPIPGKAVQVPMHLPPFIRAKDFEKVYWPSWQIYAKEMSEKGLHVAYAFERSFLHIADYLNELPKGVTGIIEEDTPWDMKKAAPNIAVMGGFPNQLLYYGTKQECIDYAKMVIDNMAPYDGFMFTVARQMLTPADGKVENLKAVNEFVHEYGVYK